MIDVKKDGPVFHLKAGGCSYVVSVLADRYLAHAYWGGELKSPDVTQLLTLGSRPYSVTVNLEEELAKDYNKVWGLPEGSLTDRRQQTAQASFSPERLPQEYPIAGMGDLREPAVQIRYADGSATGRLEYKDYRIIEGVPGPDGLPYVSSPPQECRTLQIKLEDTAAGLSVYLHYLPLPDLPVILRWTRVGNDSDSAVEIDQIASASLDLPAGDTDYISLNGAWGRERHIHRAPVGPGVQQVESRGGASSHQHSPFIAITDRETTETDGRVWASSLIYGGNHRHFIEQDQFGSLRLQSGINPGGFTWTLGAGESFDTPAAVLAYSDTGIGGISDAYHPFVRQYLFQKNWRDKDRPIVVNTWEAHYFDVNSKNVVEMATLGSEIGAELLVVDDGWFENRRDDRRALGDWFPDRVKFPGGLGETVKKVRDTGMEFGLWVEPEMVNLESKLFERHPDWALLAPGREPLLTRNQLILNLALPEVVEYLLDLFSGIFSSAPIAYVKWDMNRYMVESDSPAVPHKYILGLYQLWSSLTEHFPHILFEGCAGGGGRFDFGSLAYMPQFWTSDQTDAVERQSIQFGTSLLFPPETMGAHVSAVPNHQVGRSVPAETRGLTALAFNFGFELNLVAESRNDMATYACFSELYKEHRALFRTGRFVRLLPEQHSLIGNKWNDRRPGSYAWSIISTDRSRAIIFYFQTLAVPNDDGRWLRLRDLDEEASYRDRDRELDFHGSFLINRGLWLPPSTGDYRSAYWILEKTE